MRRVELVAVLIVALMIVGCKSTEVITAKDVRVAPKSGATVGFGDIVDFSYETQKSVDSVVLLFDADRYKFNTTSLKSPEISRYGEFEYSIIFYSSGGRYVVNGSLNCPAPQQQEREIKIIKSISSPNQTHTQGFCIDDNIRYESSGEYGKSYVRSVDLSTNKEIARTELDARFFGEGAAVVGDELYVLTWQENVVLVFDKKSLELKKSYPIKGEGWGLTYNGEYLYLSDGTSTIYTLSPKDMSIVASNKVVNQNGEIPYLNELEYIDGYIYANVFTTDYIVKINPNTWCVETLYHAGGLWVARAEYNTEDVLNGIAYNKQNNKIYITGKKWDKIYEVKF